MYMVVIMNNLLVYLSLFIAVVAGDDVDESCRKMFTPEFMEEDCCETVFESDEDMSENFEICDANYSEESEESEEAKCDYMKCYLENIGIWKDDEINNEAAKKRLEQMESKYPNNNKTAQRISKQCLDGKYLEYGAEEICPPMKYFFCHYINTLFECDSWMKTEQCLKNSEYASKCKAFFDNNK